MNQWWYYVSVVGELVNLEHMNWQKESEIMTNKWRINVTMPNDIERAIVELRKKDEYSRLSYSEIIRQLIVKGLKTVEKAS